MTSTPDLRAGQPLPALPARSPSSPPPDSQYHRLARTARHRWWSPLVGTLLVIALFVPAGGVLSLGFVVAATFAGVSEGRGDSLFDDPVWEDTYALALLAVAVPVVLVAARLTRGRPAGTLSSVTGRLRLGWLLRCLLVAMPAFAVVMTGMTAVELFRGEPISLEFTGWVGWRRFLIGLLIVSLLVPFQCAAEEYVTRGWIIQSFGAWLRNPWPGIVVGAVVFAVLHGLSEVSGFAALMWFGLVFGWLAVRTGGLEAGIAYHIANNLTLFVLLAAFGGLGSEGDTTAADAGWSLFAVEAVVLPLYALVVRLLHRRGGQRSTSAPTEPGDVPAEPDGPPAETGGVPAVPSAAPTGADRPGGAEPGP